MINYSVIILAAGRSQRMGFDKYSLLDKNQIPFIESIANAYIAYGCKKIVLVVNEYFKSEKDLAKFPNVKIVYNKHLDKGRFYSLYLGCGFLDNDEYVFIHNVDNPYVDFSTLSTLKQNVDCNEYVYPVFKGKGGHPALISTKIVECIKQKDEIQLPLNVFFKSFKYKALEVDNPNVLFNINTLEDYRSWLNGV